MSDDQVRRLGDLPLFDPTSGPNFDINITWDINDNPTIIEKIVNGVLYRKTLTWVAGTNGFVVTDITPWVKI